MSSILYKFSGWIAPGRSYYTEQLNKVWHTSIQRFVTGCVKICGWVREGLWLGAWRLGKSIGGASGGGERDSSPSIKFFILTIHFIWIFKLSYRLPSSQNFHVPPMRLSSVIWNRIESIRAPYQMRSERQAHSDMYTSVSPRSCPPPTPDSPTPAPVPVPAPALLLLPLLELHSWLAAGALAKLAPLADTPLLLQRWRLLRLWAGPFEPLVLNVAAAAAGAEPIDDCARAHSSD